MRALLVVALSLASGCSGNDASSSPDPSPPDASPVDAATYDVVSDRSVDAIADTARPDVHVEAGTYLFNLDAAPFPNTGHPDVAVHVPSGFDPLDRPGVIVFFHGFSNCVANVVGAVNSPCTSGGPARPALHLAEQLEAARVNALLVALQLRYDMRSGDVGQLAQPGQLRLLLSELLVGPLAPVLGYGLTVEQLDRVVVATHSGGYRAAAAVVQTGGVASLFEVDLYDSLYGEMATYDAWVLANLARFGPNRADGVRFTDVYTAGGGTAVYSRAMASRVAGWIGDAGLPWRDAALAVDDTTATLTDAQVAAPLLFKLTAVAHDDIPRVTFERFARAAGFSPAGAR
ncbi:MAG: hypothetical protein WCI05_04535 [Myxococcales bacterium]